MNASGLDTILNALRGEKSSMGSEKPTLRSENPEFLAAFDAASRAAESQSGRSNPPSAARELVNRVPAPASDKSQSTDKPQQAVQSEDKQSKDSAESGKVLPQDGNMVAETAAKMPGAAAWPAESAPAGNTPQQGPSSVADAVRSVVASRQGANAFGNPDFPGTGAGLSQASESSRVDTEQLTTNNRAFAEAVRQAASVALNGQAQGPSGSMSKAEIFGDTQTTDPKANITTLVESKPAAVMAEAAKGLANNALGSPEPMQSARNSLPNAQMSTAMADATSKLASGAQAGADSVAVNTAAGEAAKGLASSAQGSPGQLQPGRNPMPGVQMSAAMADATGKSAPGARSSADSFAVNTATAEAARGLANSTQGSQEPMQSARNPLQNAQMSAAIADVTSKSAPGVRSSADSVAVNTATAEAARGLANSTQGSPGQLQLGRNPMVNLEAPASIAANKTVSTSSPLANQSIADISTTAESTGSNLRATDVTGLGASTALTDAAKRAQMAQPDAEQRLVDEAASSQLAKTRSALTSDGKSQPAVNPDSRALLDVPARSASGVQNSETAADRFAKFANTLRASEAPTPNERAGFDKASTFTSGYGATTSAAQAGNSTGAADISAASALGDGQTTGEIDLKVNKTALGAAEKGFEQKLQDVAEGDASSASSRSTRTDPANSVDASLTRGFESAVMSSGVQGTNAATTARAAENAAQLMNQPDLSSTPDSPEFPEEILGRLRLLQTNGSQEARLNLHPAELGRMQISIITEGDSTRVAFSVDNPQARDALEQAMPRLRELLNQAGLQLADSSVTQQGQQHQPGAQGSFGDRNEGSGSRLTTNGDNETEPQPSTEDGRPSDPDRAIDAYV